MKDLLDAKDHTSVTPDPRTTWMNIAQVLLIAQFIVKPTSSTAQQEKMKMVANYPTNVSRRSEDLMENFVLSIAQKNVKKANCFVPEALMKPDAKDLANAEIKKSTDGDQELKPNPNPNALDTAHPNALHTKSFAHHSLILVTVAQQKRFVEKPSRTLTESSAQERKLKD